MGTERAPQPRSVFFDFEVQYLTNLELLFLEPRGSLRIQ
jgi:hypothetical protein